MYGRGARWIGVVAILLVGAREAPADAVRSPSPTLTVETSLNRSAPRTFGQPADPVTSTLSSPPPSGVSYVPAPGGSVERASSHEASFGAISFEEPWSWQVLPEGVIYRSYLAGAKEPRFASAWVHDRDRGWIWDVSLGGRVGLIRYGTRDALRPAGWQLDFEGAALPRLDLGHDRDVVATDYRVGVPLTHGEGPFRWKFAYYHLCSHLADEYLLRYPDAVRLNYIRDSLVLGTSYDWADDLRLYAEAAWAFNIDDGAQPWEFQFGIDYSPLRPTGFGGAPFVAVNGHLREELDFGGNLVFQTGWQWRGPSAHLFRAGMQYYVGKSDQFEFFDDYEEKLGLAIWYDF